jgi:hypothetical protein
VTHSTKANLARPSSLRMSRAVLLVLAVTWLAAGCSRSAAVGTATTQAAAPQPAAPAHALPDRLSDKDFWMLESEISEPGGYFRIEDNYTSNEMEIGQLYGLLRESGVEGGVYMGVGPEQNFTYIAAIRPKMAFIVDIRRQAVMQHLMFKAMFELANDRADFISVLFAKPRPAGIDTSTSIQKIWEAYRNVATDSLLRVKNYARVIDRLTKTHGFTFTEDESAKLKAVFDAFYYFGPSITTRGAPGGRGGSGDFTDLTAYSNDRTGQPRSFLSSEANYRFVKSLHERNLIVPVSGDFGGPKTIRAIGSYVKDHHGTIRAFYVSNVEQYLFGDHKDSLFYANVATLPIDSASVFIRPYSLRRPFGGAGTTQPLCPIGAFLIAVRAARVGGYNQSLSCGA